MILTRENWNRSTYAQRCRQRERVAVMRTVFACSCVQCYCGSHELVARRGVPLCKQCGRPMRDSRGHIIPIGHAYNCPHGEGGESGHSRQAAGEARQVASSAV